MEKEERLIKIAKEIVEMKNTVLGIIGKVGELTGRIDDSNTTDYDFFKEWFEETVGHELNVARDAIEIRKTLVDYLKSKNIDVPEDNQLEMEQFGFDNGIDHFENWINDNTSVNISSRKR